MHLCWSTYSSQHAVEFGVPVNQTLMVRQQFRHGIVNGIERLLERMIERLVVLGLEPMEVSFLESVPRSKD